LNSPDEQPLIRYIIANIPGAMAGAFAGNRLGAIRDAKGKPVAHVFAQLGGAQKAEVRKAHVIKLGLDAHAYCHRFFEPLLSKSWEPRCRSDDLPCSRFIISSWCMYKLCMSFLSSVDFLGGLSISCRTVCNIQVINLIRIRKREPFSLLRRSTGSIRVPQRDIPSFASCRSRP
jgi:hypothetical protein